MNREEEIEAFKEVLRKINGTEVGDINLSIDGRPIDDLSVEEIKQMREILEKMSGFSKNPPPDNPE